MPEFAAQANLQICPTKFADDELRAEQSDRSKIRAKLANKVGEVQPLAHIDRPTGADYTTSQ
jgi:hypothetical protein